MHVIDRRRPLPLRRLAPHLHDRPVSAAGGLVSGGSSPYIVGKKEGHG